MHWPRVHGLAALDSVWRKAMETEISAGSGRTLAFCDYYYYYYYFVCFREILLLFVQYASVVKNANNHVLLSFCSSMKYLVHIIGSLSG